MHVLLLLIGGFYLMSFSAHPYLLYSIGVAWLISYHLEYTHKRFIAHLIAFSIPVVLTWYFYHTHLNAWWLADDPALLQAIAEHGVLPHFYDSTVWRQVSPANLTPWLIASLGMDWYGWQLEPLGYYIHHFVSFILVLSISYFTLKYYFSPTVVSITLSLFVLSTPVAHLLQFLMVRHYLEGLGFAIAAFFFYFKLLREPRRRWLFLSNLSYLLAITAKEIYVPLVVLLPFLPEATWKKRLYYLIPMIILAGLYVVWRAEMLQWHRLVSGYDSSLVPKLTTAYIQDLPLRLLQILNWLTVWQQSIFGVIIGLFALFTLWRARITEILFILVLLALVTIPIIPVLTLLDTRYLVLPYFIFCLGMGWTLQQLRHHHQLLLSLGLGFGAIFASVSAIQSLSFKELQQQYRTEGQFILQGESGTLLQPTGMYWYYQGLQRLRHLVLQLPENTYVCYDSCSCTLVAPLSHFAKPSQSVVLSEHFPECVDKSHHLQAVVNFKNDILSWQLVPQSTGQYYASLSTNRKLHGQFFPVPPSGQFAVVAQKVYVIFKYVAAAPQYSPVFELTATH